MADKVIVKGLGRLDGEYEFDLLEMLGIGTTTSLTNRELHRVKTMTGLRAGELIDAFESGDNDAIVALSAVILTRHGKTFSDDLLWDAQAETALTFDLSDSTKKMAEEDEDPTQPAEEQESQQSGGESLSPPSDSQENGQSRTGTLALATVTSGQG